MLATVGVQSSEVSRLLELSNDSISQTGDDVKHFSDIDSEVKNSLKLTDREVGSLQNIGKKIVNQFTQEDIKVTENFAKLYYKEIGTKSPFFRSGFGDWREYDITSITVAIDTAKRAYQLQHIEKYQQSDAKGSGKFLSPVIQTADISTVSDLFSCVKQKDSDFRPNQASAAFINEDGTPELFYRSTNAAFTVFKPKGRRLSEF